MQPIINTTFKYHLHWSLLFIFGSLLMGGESLAIIVKDESLAVGIATLNYILLFLIVETVLLTISYFSRNRYLYSGMMAIFLTLNFFGLKLLFFPDVATLNITIYWCIFVFIAVVLFFLIKNLIKKNKWIGWKSCLIVAVIFISPAFIQYYSYKTFGSKQEAGHLDAWSDLNLKEKPNIYLLSFDSLIPKEIAAKYLDIRKTHYEEIIADKFFEIPHSLSFWVPSTLSMNSVMRLDQKSQRWSPNLFAGREASVLGKLLKGNGYTINTGFASTYFGIPGSYVDDHITLDGVLFDKTTLCLDVGDSIRSKSRLLFLCPVYSSFQKKKNNSFLFDELFSLFFWVQEYDWHNKKLNYIKNLSLKNQPALTFFYTYDPIGHTSLDYDHNNLEMRASYQSTFDKKSEKLVGVLRDLIDVISKHDPTSIVIIFGDHGAWMSRQENKSKNPEFFYQDRHRILMALMKTKNKCSNPELNYAVPYSTPSRLLLDVFLCLGMDKDVLDEKIDFDEYKNILPYLFPEKPAFHGAS